MIDTSLLKCWIVGGTNGSGKSSIYQNSRELQGSGEFVNADLIARGISPGRPESVSRLAGRRVIERLDRLISDQRNFVYETTLSSHQSLDLLSTARNSGYRVGLMFVVLSNVGLNVRRVHERVSRGGHSIPDDVIRRRYARGFANFPKAIRIAHETVVFENSGSVPVKLISLIGGKIVQNALDETTISHVEVAEAVGDALKISLQSVLRATSL
ncbi:zeta toxin family protein [Bradyrhizobium sp.]|uniref:zeta toxin family protein n=1 Tax=Bradyrhizobium sp. TaxID=376 RepID=UPI0027160F3D|nr:zeta toxin family protein [Bradyrhizobium sp.]MDO9297209.1 zeta toxin family protein [Bradyrhizobium sp.]